MTDRDTTSLHSESEKVSHEQNNKPLATTEHLEHYVAKSGYSSDLAAVQQAHGFKPTDGRLVVDPAEARVEYGDEIASRLKTNRKGTKILWPQRESTTTFLSVESPH